MGEISTLRQESSQNLRWARALERGVITFLQGSTTTTTTTTANSTSSSSNSMQEIEALCQRLHQNGCYLQGEINRRKEEVKRLEKSCQRKDHDLEELKSKLM